MTPLRQQRNRSGSDTGEDGASAAAVPLLYEQENHRFLHFPLDTRFAISEEDAGDAHLDVQDDDESEAETSGAKYPPTLPPSYREVMYVDDPWYKSELALSFRHYLNIALSGIATVIRRYWPTSRFAQAGFFIVGLWMVVIITGSNWDKTSKLTWGKARSDFLALIPPPPINGDGRYLSLADWSMPSCRSSESGRSTYCTRKADFNLTIPAANNAFMTSDKVFVFVDPLRSDGLSDDRGTVPAIVEVKKDGTSSAKVFVEIFARYEKEFEPLLQRANIGLMSAGLHDCGVGIYTWPMPPHLRVAPTQIYPFPLLSFKIVLHIHPASRVPTIKIDGANVDVAFYHSIPVDAPFNQKRGSEGLRLVDKARLDHLRFRHAAGKHRSKQLEPARRRNEDLASHPFFGNVRLTVGKGDLSFGGSLRAIGRVWAVTDHGNIDIGAQASMRINELHLEARKGSILVGKGSQLEARDVVNMLSNNAGDVHTTEDVVVSATRATAEARQGSVVASFSEWKTNHTLVFNGLKGVVAQVGIAPPYRPELGVGTEQRPWVSIDARSPQGEVNVRFKTYVPNTPLRGTFRSDTADVDIVLHREYAGSYHVVSSSLAGSEVTSPKDLSDDAGGRDRMYSSQNNSTAARFESTGEIWWKEHGKSSKQPQGEEWGSIDIAAQSGVAHLAFDTRSA